MPMIRRAAFTYQFKGRERRALLYRKRIYEEWFLFAKLSCNKVPVEFGDLSTFTFDEWWKHPDYGFELFCEPVEEEPLLVVDEISRKKGYKYLRVDTNAEPAKVKKMFRTFVKKNINPNPKIESHARFQPSKSARHIKMNALKNYRTSYEKRVIDGKSRKEVLIDRFGDTLSKPEDLWDMLRCVSRDVQKAKQIMKSIERGTFP